MAKTILLAEDSVTIQKVVEMTFAAEDFDVMVAATGQDAIKLALSNQPDIVIADLSMEGENGYDICSTLKSLDAHTDIPVLLLHGNASKFDEARARSVGANGEISKPFESQALTDRVKILCGVPVTASPVPAPAEPAKAPPRPTPEATDEIAFDTSALSPATKPVHPTKRQGPPPPPRKKGPPPPPPRRRTEPGRSVEAQGQADAAFPLNATPRPTPPPARELVAAAPTITIEAEMPTGSDITEPLPSFDNPEIPSAPTRPPALTMQGFIGADLPPPPEGMSLPLAASPARPAVAPAAEATPVVEAVPAVDEPTPTLKPVVDEPTPTLKPVVDEPTPKPAPKPEPVSAGGEMDAAMREAILKISREVIERVVWEVVPDLVERIINEELDRLIEGKEE